MNEMHKPATGVLYRRCTRWSDSCTSSRGAQTRQFAEWVLEKGCRTLGGSIINSFKLKAKEHSFARTYRRIPAAAMRK